MSCGNWATPCAMFDDLRPSDAPSYGTGVANGEKEGPLPLFVQNEILLANSRPGCDSGMETYRVMERRSYGKSSGRRLTPRAHLAKRRPRRRYFGGVVSAAGTRIDANRRPLARPTRPQDGAPTFVLFPMQKRCLKPRRKTWPSLIAGEA